MDEKTLKEWHDKVNKPGYRPKDLDEEIKELEEVVKYLRERKQK